LSYLGKIFILFAVAFAVAGDYYLKRYGDERRGWDLVLCLVLWEVCALGWVLAYRQHLPLGRSTVFGQALVVAANLAVGSFVFSEQLKPVQSIGAACVLIGIFLVSS
jgi:multidrug transporter EmrE-like cation transporter